jgi:hypothetical protein
LRGYDHFEPSRGGPSAPSRKHSNIDKSETQSRYTQKDFHHVVGGEITGTIQVFTERSRSPVRKQPKHRRHKVHNKHSEKPSEPQTRYEHPSTYNSRPTEQYRPTKVDQSVLGPEDGYSYYGSRDACSAVPDIWEAGSTTSPACQGPMSALNPPYQRLLLEAPPSRASVQSDRRYRDDEPAFSGDTRVSRGRQPHRT